MSTTQAQTNPVKQGECVVCGKTCWTRCSGCGGKGIEWMYFCSVEHQRFIWFAHKRTCGLNPFLWPRLTEVEKEEWQKLRFLDFEVESGTIVTWDKLLEKHKLPFEDMLHAVGEVGGDDRAKNIRVEELTSPVYGLRLLRATAFDIRRQQVVKKASSPSDILEIHQRTAGDVYGYLGSTLTDLEMELDDLERYEWYSDLHHRLLIFFAIVCRHFKAPELLTQGHARLLRHSSREVERIVGDRVSKDLPLKAEEIKASVSQRFGRLENPATGEGLLLWNSLGVEELADENDI